MVRGSDYGLSELLLSLDGEVSLSQLIELLYYAMYRGTSPPRYAEFHLLKSRLSQLLMDLAAASHQHHELHVNITSRNMDK